MPVLPSSDAMILLQELEQMLENTNDQPGIDTLTGAYDLFRESLKRSSLGEHRVYSSDQALWEFVARRAALSDNLVHDGHRLISRIKHMQANRQPLADTSGWLRIMAELTAALGAETLSGVWQAIPRPVWSREADDTGSTSLELVISHIEKDGNGFRLTCLDAGGGECRLHIPDKLTIGRTWVFLKPGRTIRVHGASIENDKLYSLTPDSRLVLEPDYLFDVTAMAECFQYDRQTRTLTGNPLIYLLHQYFPTATSAAIVKGKMVNEALDGILTEPETSPDEIVHQALSEPSVGILTLSDDTIAGLMHQVSQEHLPNLFALRKELSSKVVLVEPTFHAPAFGLQGRLDVLWGPEDTGENIVELKSGRPPRDPNQVWDNHRMQVTGYNLLLRSAFGDGWHGDGAILYSSATESPLRNVYSAPSFENMLLELRNRVMGILLDLAEGQTAVFDWMRPGKFGVAPRFMQNDIERFHEVLQGASELERAWFAGFTAFVLRESLSDRLGMSSSGRDGFRALWRSSSVEKEAGLSILTRLEPGSFDVEANHLEFFITASQSTHFREGDIVLMYPMSRSDNPTAGIVHRGMIKHLESERVSVYLWNRRIDPDTFASAGAWAMEADFMDRSTSGTLQSLFRFLEAEKAVRERILGLVPPRFDPVVPVDLPVDEPEHRQILQTAVACRDWMLIQGPPGTGKTTNILARLIEHLTHNTGETVVALAFTNRATDGICEKLDRLGIDFVRLGSSEHENAWNNLIRRHTLRELRQKLRTARVIVSTVSTFAIQQADLVRLIRFDTLIVDEASQLSEGQIAGIVASFNRFFLIGDQNQLPPVVTQNPENCLVIEDILRKGGFSDYRQSLFERLFTKSVTMGWDNAAHRLRGHYRMHAEIAELVNPFYEQGLIARLSVQKVPVKAISGGMTPLGEILGDARVVFIDSPSERLRLKRHDIEAARIECLVRWWRKELGDGFDPQQIGVITPWRAQIAAIRERLSDDPVLREVVVDSVERFQGSERDVIILGFAVGAVSQLRSLKSVDGTGRVDRKLNVAISRARKRLILLGDPGILSADPLYATLLERIRVRFRRIDRHKARALFSQSGKTER